MKSITKNTSIAMIAMIAISTSFISCENEGPTGPQDNSITNWEYTDRYRSEFVDGEDISTEFDVLYGISSELKMDIYMPDESDPVTARPVVLLSPGGNYGNYTHLDDIRQLALTFAKRGYVAAAVRFSRTNNGNGITDPTAITIDQMAEVGVRASMDQKAAIRYFRKFVDKYRVDEGNIWIGGWSTGAQLALANSMISSLSEFDEMGDQVLAEAYKNKVIAAGGLDGSSGNAGFSSEVKGFIGMMPAMADLGWIDANDPAMFIITHDESHNPASNTDMTGIIRVNTSNHNFNMYGHDYISERMEKVGIDGVAKLIHDDVKYPNIAPFLKKYWDEMANFMADRLD